MSQALQPSPVRSFSLRKKIVLFVSTGDTCRSPMAAGYFRKLLAEREVKGVEVRAAGVMTVTGLRASQEAQQVMEAVEVDLGRHRSSQLTPESIRRADLILGMSPLHVQHALRESPEARGKTYLLKELARSDLKNIQISDPMGCTLEVFKKCFKEIRQACDRLIETDKVKELIPPAERQVPTRPAAEPVAAKSEKPASAAKPKAAASAQKSGTKTSKSAAGKAPKETAKKGAGKAAKKASARSSKAPAASKKKKKAAPKAAKKTPKKTPAGKSAKAPASRKTTKKKTTKKKAPKRK